jgi:hypothetical protein
MHADHKQPFAAVAQQGGRLKISKAEQTDSRRQPIAGAREKSTSSLPLRLNDLSILPRRLPRAAVSADNESSVHLSSSVRNSNYHPVYKNSRPHLKPHL